MLLHHIVILSKVFVVLPVQSVIWTLDSQSQTHHGTAENQPQHLQAVGAHSELVLNLIPDIAKQITYHME